MSDIIFKQVIKQASSPSTILGYIADNYLEGLNLYGILKDVPLEEMKVTVEYIKEGMVFQVTKKEKEKCSKE